MRALKRGARLLALLLALALALSVNAAALSPDAFPDVAGHWAEPYLRRAVADEVLFGDERGLLAPDDPITLPETLVILSRFLWPGRASVSASGPWYAQYVDAARAMNIAFEETDLERDRFPRVEVFSVLAQAFRLIPAEPDFSALWGFADYGELETSDRPAVAALAAAGVVKGDGGSLLPYAPVTRAEFVVMLYRIVEASLPGASASLPGAAVLQNAAGLAGGRYDQPLWIAYGAGDVDLRGVTAGTVTVLTRTGSVLTDGSTSIDRLVLAGGAVDTLALAPGHVGTLVVAPGAPGSVTVLGQVDRVELIGGGHTLIVSSPGARVVVSGAGNTVALSAADSLRLTAFSENNTVVSDAVLSSVSIEGSFNAVRFATDCPAVTVGGTSCSLTGGARVDDLTVTSRTACVQANGVPKYAFPTGAGAMDFKIDLPRTFDASAPIRAAASVTGYEWTVCTLAWYLDGQLVETRSVTVSPGVNVFYLDVPLTLYDGMPEMHLLAAGLSCLDGSYAQDSRLTRLTGSADVLSGASISLVPLEHMRLSHVVAYAMVTAAVPTLCTASWYLEGVPIASERVLIGAYPLAVTLDTDLPFVPTSVYGTLELRLTLGSASVSASAPARMTYITAAYALETVTSTYAGDYTLEWALQHDYDPLLKTAWINATGYGSDTQYLIWVNRTYQRVNVFQGSAGNWTLVQCFLCGTGRAGHATPVSVSKIRTRLANGWTHKTYIVRPVVYFLTGGYAFHSRLWNHSHTALVDDRIGFPISLGCCRMYDEDIQWIYDNIPTGTTVVVH